MMEITFTGRIKYLNSQYKMVDEEATITIEEDEDGNLGYKNHKLLQEKKTE